MIQLVEYSLLLSTDEWLDVSELDPETAGPEWTPEVAEAVRPLTDLCAAVPRSVAEEAKMGYDTNLKPLLRDPVGCLMRMEKPECSLLRDCPMAVREACTGRNVDVRKGGRFPICWEWELDPKADEAVRPYAAEAAHAIVHAWRQKRHVWLVY